MNAIWWLLSLQGGACMGRFDLVPPRRPVPPGQGGILSFCRARKKVRKERGAHHSDSALRIQALIEPASALRLQRRCAIQPNVQLRNTLRAAAPQRSPTYWYSACTVGVAPAFGPRDTHSARFAVWRRNALAFQRAMRSAWLCVRLNSAPALQTQRSRRLDPGLWPEREAQIAGPLSLLTFFLGPQKESKPPCRGGTRRRRGTRGT